MSREPGITSSRTSRRGPCQPARRTAFTLRGASALAAPRCQPPGNRWPYGRWPSGSRPAAPLGPWNWTATRTAVSAARW